MTYFWFSESICIIMLLTYCLVHLLQNCLQRISFVSPFINILLIFLFSSLALVTWPNYSSLKGNKLCKIAPTAYLNEMRVCISCWKKFIFHLVNHFHTQISKVFCLVFFYLGEEKKVEGGKVLKYAIKRS